MNITIWAIATYDHMVLGRYDGPADDAWAYADTNPTMFGHSVFWVTDDELQYYAI